MYTQRDHAEIINQFYCFEIYFLALVALWVIFKNRLYQCCFFLTVFFYLFKVTYLKYFNFLYYLKQRFFTKISYWNYWIKIKKNKAILKMQIILSYATFTSNKIFRHRWLALFTYTYQRYKRKYLVYLLQFIMILFLNSGFFYKCL